MSQQELDIFKKEIACFEVLERGIEKAQGEGIYTLSEAYELFGALLFKKKYLEMKKQFIEQKQKEMTMDI